MPGVLIDEHHPFGLDYLNHNGIGGGGGGGSSGSTYDVGGYFSSTSFLHNTQSATQQHAMRRLNTFSSVGLQDSEAPQSAPHVYQRSHSFGNTGSLQQAFHLMGSSNNSAASSVTKPDLGGGLSLLDGSGGLVDDSACSFVDGSAKWVLETGLDGTTKMGRCGGSSGSSSSSDLRSSPLSFGGGGSAMMMMSSGCSPLVGSPTFCDSLHSFNKFLPSNNEDEDAWTVVDTYGCDQFRMFEFKVRRCMRGRSHDWTECPFAHPGEKARRRDPRRFHYSGTACPDFRKGSCRRGDACEYAHGVFECWLHPARYRTQPCKDGRNCRRRVCFFAHTPEQLRLLPAAAQAATVAARSAAGGGGLVASEAAASPRGGGGGVYDGAPVYEGNAFDGSSSPAATHAACSPLSHFNGLMTSAALSGHVCFPSQISSPTSTLVGHAHSPPSLSPPLSPSGSPPHSPSSTTHGWPNSMASSFSGLSAGQAAMSQAYTQAALARSQSSQGMGIGAHPHSPPVPGHRRHLDRLNSMPTLSIPSGDHRSMPHQAVGLPGSAPVSPAVGQQRNNMMELIATLQQLELRGGSASPNGSTQWLQQQQQHYSSEPSPLRRSSLGVVGTPPNHVQWEQKEPWEVDENEEGEPTVQRVESGRGLRAKIYGRLGKELPIEAGNADVPDLGWINELVKEEPEQQQTPPGEGT